MDDKGLTTLVLSEQPANQTNPCYWIDQFEVTVDEYRKFVAAAASQSVAWPAECAGWKNSPSDPEHQGGTCSATDLAAVEDNPFASQKPIRCVDWCDAKAFCLWAGKDLCGGFTNGSIWQSTDMYDEWASACSANGWAYVNGTTPESGACNVGLQNPDCMGLYGHNCAPTDVGTFPRCKSPSGAFDMIGNVAEWVAQCERDPEGGIGGMDTPCQNRGGSFAKDLQGAQCWLEIDSNSRGTHDPKIGFRCCAPLAPGEYTRVMTR
jgi:formylglycine-generating enzyme required for sulfatase activity